MSITKYGNMGSKRWSEDIIDAMNLQQLQDTKGNFITIMAIPFLEGVI